MTRKRGLSQRQQELLKEAEFTGPPEEDPIFETLCHPFKHHEHERTEEHKKTEEDREFLKVVVDYESKDPAILWFGLFTDLIFVAVIVQFANQYKNFFKYKVKDVDNETEFYLRITVETILFFFAFFTIWMELAQANVRFINIPGALDDGLYFVYLVGVIIMAVQMSPDAYLLEHHVGFMAGILICFFAIFSLHVAYYKLIPKSQAYCMRRFYGYGFGIGLLIIGIIVGTVLDESNEEAAQWFSAILVAVACSVVCIISFISFRVDPRFYNWSFDFFEERFGVLVMIVTGESILALILGDMTSDFVTTANGEYYFNSEYYPVYSYQGAFLQHGTKGSIKETICVIVAFGTMYILKNIYFDSEAEFSVHALNERGTPGSVVWVFMHFPLTFSLLGCGIGFKLLFTSIHSGSAPIGYRLILGVCVFLSLLSMLIIRAAHKKFLFPLKSMLIRIPTAMVIPLGCILIHDTFGYIMWVFGFTSLSWCYDLTIMESLELKDIPEEIKRHHATNDDPKQREYESCWDRFLTICGLHDLEYAGAFHGPKQEGDPRQLCIDVAMCTLLDQSRSAIGILPEYYINEISEHHGHGHGHEHAHGNDEAGTAHGWFSVFTDLIFVAVIIKFADQMKYKQTSMNQYDDDLVISNWEHARIYIEAAIYFCGFFICWLELQHLLIRFTNMPGIFDDIMYFLYLSGVVGMAIQMNHLEYLFDRRMGFCCWFAFSLFCLVILHGKLMQIDVAEEYCQHRVITFSCSCVLVLVGAFMEPETTAILLVISYINVLWVSLNSFRVWEESKPDPHLQFEYIERFGLIIMITTGESILALVIGDFEQDVSHYTMILVAFLTMYIFKTIYFDSHSETPEMHALAEGQMPGAVLWAFLHLPAAFFLLGCGVGYKMLLPYAGKSYVDPINRYTLGVSITGALCTIYMIRAAHTKFILPLFSVVLRFTLAAVAPVGAVFIESPLGYNGWCCGVVCLCWFCDLILIHYNEYEIHQKFKDHDAHSFYKEGIFSELHEQHSHKDDEHHHHHHHNENEMTPLTHEADGDSKETKPHNSTDTVDDQVTDSEVHE